MIHELAGARIKCTIWARPLIIIFCPVRFEEWVYVDMFAGTRFLVEKTLPCSCPRHVSRITQHVTSVGARYRGGDRRGKKQEVDYKQHRATVVLLRGVGRERRLGVWINDVIVFVQLEPSAARWDTFLDSRVLPQSRAHSRLRMHLRQLPSKLIPRCDGVRCECSIPSQSPWQHLIPDAVFPEHTSVTDQWWPPGS